MSDYRIDELMVCRIASEVDASGVTVLGSFTPLAYAAYMLAKATHARDAYLIGFNAVGMKALQMSIAGVEAQAYHGAIGRWSFIETTSTVHLGRRGLVECVSPAQVDGEGRINTSVIGDYEHPKVRLPGGAGSPEVVQNYQKLVVYFGGHDTRRLVERVDFATGGRWPISAEAREARGLLPGPIMVVTPLGVLVKDHDDRPFRVESVNPGVDVQEIVDNTGFVLEVPSQVPTTAVPTAKQIDLLRTEIDPHGTSRFDFLDTEARAEYLRTILDAEWRRAAALAEEAS
jgi:acyl CoA:acetate/3-ketoacid CoA transferase beta subunit